MSDQAELKFSKKEKKQELIRQKWIDRQMTGFLYWVNSYLAKEELKIDSIMTGFSDGVLLIKFLEMLTSQKMTQRFSANATMKVHKITNCYLALQLLDKVKGLTISAEDLVDGENVPAILGFCWQLLRQFQDTTGGEDDDNSNKRKNNSFEARLLQWVRMMVADYDVEIEDWSSFSDGKALLTLLHIFDNSLVDLNTFDMSDPLVNCQSALDIAERDVNIPSQLLDAEEIVDGSVSEKNMALYMTLFYNAFKEKENLMSKEKLISMVRGLEETLDQVKRETSELDNSQTTLEQDLDEQTQKINFEKQQIDDLEKWQSSAHSNWEDEKNAILREIAQLEQDIADLKLKSDDTITGLQQESEAILNEKNDLVSQTDALEFELKNIKKDSVILYKKSKREKKATENLQDYFNSTVELRNFGMSIIRSESLAHFHDVNTWSDFLHDGDVKENYEPTLTEEDLSELDFINQFEKMNEFVSAENKALGELLAEKLLVSVKVNREEEKVQAERKTRKTRKIKVDKK